MNNNPKGLNMVRSESMEGDAGLVDKTATVSLCSSLPAGRAGRGVLCRLDSEKRTDVDPARQQACPRSSRSTSCKGKEANTARRVICSSAAVS